jgi:DHA1 family tetracycline resistance protein-like MFS transporter
LTWSAADVAPIFPGRPAIPERLELSQPLPAGADEPVVSAAASRPAAMRFIMITVLIDMMAIGLIVPVLPLLVGSFTADPVQAALWYGAVAFAFSLANFFGAPILGALSDRYGRRPVLLLGFCGLALNFFATALATQLWMLIAVRLVGGAMQANAAVANAYVADITAPQDRARRFGMLGAMFGLGFIIGPVMGGLLGGINLHLPFFAAGVLALLNLMYGLFVLPESLPLARRSKLTWGSANPITSLKQLGATRGIGSLVLVIALSNLAQFVMYTNWVLYTGYRFGWGPTQNGWSLFAVGVAAAVVQGFLLSRLLKRFSPQRLVIVGLVSSSLGYLFWGLSTEGWMMYAVIACNLLGFTVTASLQSIVSNAAGSHSQGQTMGAVAALTSLMAVLGPVIGSPLMAAVSHLPPADWRVGTPFFFCSAMQLLSMLIASRHFGRQRRLGAASAA